MRIFDSDYHAGDTSADKLVRTGRGAAGAFAAGLQRDVGGSASGAGAGIFQRNLFRMRTAALAGDAFADKVPARIKDDAADRWVCPGKPLVEPGERQGPAHHPMVAAPGWFEAHGKAGRGLARAASR